MLENRGRTAAPAARWGTETPEPYVLLRQSPNEQKSLQESELNTRDYFRSSLFRNKAKSTKRITVTNTNVIQGSKERYLYLTYFVGLYFGTHSKTGSMQHNLASNLQKKGKKTPKTLILKVIVQPVLLITDMQYVLLSVLTYTFC